MADPRLINPESTVTGSFSTGRVGGGTRDDSGRFEGVSHQFSRMDGFRAARKQGQFDAASSVLDRMQQRRQLFKQAEEADSPIVDPDTLNEMFGEELAAPFKVGVPMEVAEFIVDRHREIRRLDQIISETPDGALSGLAILAGGMSAFVTDPAELLADVLLGPAVGAVGAAARVGARGSRAAIAARRAQMGEERALRASEIARKVEKFGRKTEKVGEALLRSGSFGTSVARGLSVNIASEGLAQVNSAQDQLDRSFMMAMASVAGGTVALAGLGALGRRAINELAHHQVLKDTHVNTDPIVNEFNARGRGSGSGTEYRFNPHRVEVVKNTLFMPSKTKKMSGAVTMGEVRVGKRGIVMGDKYSEVNAAAADPYKAPGTIFAVKAKRDLNLLDLDAPIDNPSVVGTMVGAVVEAYQRFKPMTGKKTQEIEARYRKLKGDRETKTAREFFEQIEEDIHRGRLNDDALDAVEAALEAAGFDGFSYTNSGRGPIKDPRLRVTPNSPTTDPALASNMFKVFNRDLLDVGSRVTAKKSDAGKAYTRKQLQQIREAQGSTKQDVSYSPEVDNIRKNTPDKPLEVEGSKEFTAREQASSEDIAKVIESAPEEFRAELEVMHKQYTSLAKFSDKIESTVKGAIKCLGGR